MANKYAVSTGNWSAGGAGGIWYDAASGGAETTKPGSGDNAYLTTGVVVSINEAVTCDLISTNGTSGQIKVPDGATATITAAVSSSYAGTMLVWGTGTVSLTITGAVTYSGTSSSGMFAPSSASHTLVINGKVTSSSSGQAIVAGGGAITITVASGDAIYVTGAGRGINCNAGSPTATVTGNVTVTADGYGVAMSAGTVTITGNIVCGNINGYGVRLSTGTLTLNGLPILSVINHSLLGPVYMNGGTLVWTGALAVSDSQYVWIQGPSGTLNASNLTLSNSGRCMIGGAFSVTLSSTVFRNQTATAQMVIATATAVTITGPVLPTAAQTVRTGTASYGYAAALYDGTYYGPNLDSNAGVVTADAVITTAHYGVANATQGAATSGYTYGDNSAAKVLTTATGAGTYHAPEVAEVLSTADVGVLPNKGTYVAPVTGQVLAPAQGGTAFGPASGTNGTLTFANTQYVLSTAADYGVAGTGGAKTATIPTASNVLTGSGAYGVNGSGSTPSYSPDFPDVGNVTTTDTVDGAAGTLDMSLYVLITGVAAAGDVRVGVDRYTGGPPGTLQGIIDSAGAVTTVGCLVSGTRYATGTVSSAGAYNATGVIYGSGDYATEASRNNATAGAGQILTGYSVTLLGSTIDGSATAESHTANQVLKSAGGNYNDDNLSVGNVRPVAFGLAQTGTLANLAATDLAYVSLEESRNNDNGTVGLDMVAGKSVKIRNVTIYGLIDMGDYVLMAGIVWPAEADVWHDTGTYGPTGVEYTPAKTGSTITNLIAANVKLNVTIDDVLGAYGGGGGGYTYGDDDPSQVLTTADSPGSYLPIADSDTVDGGVLFGSGEVGTGMTALEVEAAITAALAIGVNVLRIEDTDATDALEAAAAAAIAAAGLTQGTGPLRGTVTVDDGSDGIPLASIRISLAGATQAVLATDEVGEAETGLEATTYEIAVRAEGHNPYVGTLVITADSWSETISLESISPPSPSTPPFVTGRYTAYAEGVAQAGQTIELQLHTLPAGDFGGAYDRDYSEVTGVDGVATFLGLIPLAVYLGRRNSGPWRRVTVPADDDLDGYVDLTSIFGP